MTTATLEQGVVRGGEGDLLSLGGGVGMRRTVAGQHTGGRFEVVEHPMDPGSLIEPHTHSREDEISYVVEGRLGVLLGDKEFEVEAGAYIVKPRGVRHAVWNASAKPARFVEMVTPAGFTTFFDEVAALFGGAEPPADDALPALAERYGLEFDFEAVAGLIVKHRLAAVAPMYGIEL
jgi:quercetin dioxygenase-like cupin family protein